MPENRKLSEIQLVNEVFDIQGKSTENQNTAQSAFSDKYDWVGTTEEYQEQQVNILHPEWVCYITDDIRGETGVLDLKDYVKTEDYEADQINVIHKTGIENITGTKTFIENDSQVTFITKSKTVDDTQNPISIQYTDFIDNHDKNNVLLSRIYTDKKSDGSNGINIQAWKGNTNYVIGVDSAGRTIAPWPGITSSTSDSNIALTGWVNDPSKSTNVVHRSGDEQISGTKTLTNSSYIIKKYGNKPDGSNHYNTVIESRDSDDNIVSYYRTYFNTSNNIETDIMAHRKISGTDYYSSVGAVITSAGALYGVAPASDVNGSIVTTVNKSKGQNGYFKLGNGMIVQWGLVATTGGSRSITFPTAFSSAASWKASITPTGSNTGALYTVSINNQTSTGCNILSGGNVDNVWLMWVAVGY